jgi:hypothetical protein
MRLDSGNFADQGRWVAKQVDGWSASLTLAAPGPAGNLFVDLTGSQGLRRQDRAPAGSRVLFVDVGPICADRRADAVAARSTTTKRQPDDLPPREQRLLLMRLASLFGPDAIARSPRAARYSAEGEVRVVWGLGRSPAPSPRSIGSPMRRARQASRRLRRNHRDDQPQAGPETIAKRIRGRSGDRGSQRHQLPPHRTRK